jgi:heme exporter protein C
LLRDVKSKIPQEITIVPLPMKNIKTVILGLTLILMLVAIYSIFIYAPYPSDDSGFAAPKAQKIFYFHLPSAITCYIAFIVVFISSILYLHSKKQKFDIAANSAAEIGIIFCSLALITGALWGKAEWNEYWRWEDIRLVTFLILWLIFIAYLGLRSAVDEDEKRARLSAVFGIVGFVGVPLSYFSMYIWRTFHPIVISPGGGGLIAEMGVALMISFITFIFMFVYLLLKRINISYLEDKVEELKDLMEGVENER